MTYFVGVVSQKGGVGKSTLARMIAREYAAAGWSVKIADLDPKQGTSMSWHTRRLTNALSPEVPVEQFQRVSSALRAASPYQLMIFDGAPHATDETLEIARQAHLLVLPTGLSLDDLEPTIMLAHEFIDKGIGKERIALALCRVGDSPKEFAEARDYIQQAGYLLLDGVLPEKTAYRRASDLGRTPAETQFPTLNQKAEQLAQATIDRLQFLIGQEGEEHADQSATAATAAS